MSHNVAQHRFEIQVDGGMGILDYARTGDQLRLLRTEVPVQARGRGYAGQLVQSALEYAKREQLRVIPVCSYVQDYIMRNPEDQSVVDSMP